MMYRSQEEAERFSHARQAPSESEAELEDYLDHLAVELVGVVPYRRRQELRAEVRSHLFALADAFEELGSSPAEAMAQALDQFGEPRQIARQWVQEWKPSKKQHRSTQPLCLRTGLLTTLPWLLLPNLLAWFRVAVDAWRPGVVTPELLLLWPLLTGSLAGYLGKGSRTAGACLSLALCTLVTTLLLSLTTADHLREQLTYLAVMQFMVWIPLGTLSAAITAHIRERQEKASIPARPVR